MGFDEGRAMLQFCTDVFFCHTAQAAKGASKANGRRLKRTLFDDIINSSLILFDNHLGIVKSLPLTC